MPVNTKESENSDLGIDYVSGIRKVRMAIKPCFQSRGDSDVEKRGFNLNRTLWHYRL
jgi:hypothetical protein